MRGRYLNGVAQHSKHKPYKRGTAGKPSSLKESGVVIGLTGPHVCRETIYNAIYALPVSVLRKEPII